MAKQLDGRVAIVTGSGNNIGRGVAHVLADRGARVVIADIDGERAAKVAGEINTLGHDALAVTVDVSEEDQVAAMVDAAVRTFGRLDIMHNNASDSAAHHMDHDVDVMRMDVAHWDRTMAVNVRGTMLGCKHALPHLIAAGGGSIINTSSGSAFRGDMGRTAYGTSKAAIIALTKYVAAQYGRDGIRCNAIVPRAAWTDGRTFPLPQKVLDRMALLSTNLLGRPGTPEDIGRAVAFLASDDAAWVTGDVLIVDGGAQTIQPWWSASREAYEDDHPTST
jgi:NAD(P)-dependent dehydrogenase (short-subunit alcohol dehydrogenase family)